jgi:hypothetical protein
VLADSCNGHKSDHLAAADHARHWAARLTDRSDDLATIASTCGWGSESNRTLAIGRSSYFHLPSGTPLWVRGGTFVDDDPQSIASAL